MLEHLYKYNIFIHTHIYIYALTYSMHTRADTYVHINVHTLVRKDNRLKRSQANETLLVDRVAELEIEVSHAHSIHMHIYTYI